MRTNTHTSYGSVARFFHWTVALLIFGLLIGGFVAGKIPRNADTVELLKNIYSIHKTLGVTVLVLAILRILWALRQPSPVALHPERKLESFAAEVVHYGLYVAIILMPLSGWVMHSAEEGFAPILWPFGQNLPFVPKSEHIAMTAGTVHYFAAWAIVLALVAHIGGAIKHVVIDKDNTLARMSKGVAAGDENQPHSALAKFAPVLAVIGWIAVVSFSVFIAGQGGGHDHETDHAQTHEDHTQGDHEHEHDQGDDSAAAEAAPATQEASLVSDAPIWTVTEGSLGISVKQMGADVAGSFANWAAQIAYDPETGAGQTRVRIDTTSITLGSVTSQATGEEFFNVATFPEAVFAADISQVDGAAHQAVGTLTLVGQEVPVTLDFTLAIDGGVATMTGETLLDRRDFGMGSGYPDESNVGFAVPVSVRLTATLQ